MSTLDSIYQIDLKISVPNTVSFATPEIRSKLVGKRPISALWETSKTLDEKLGKILRKEINDQLPEDAKAKLKEYRKMKRESRRHKEMMGVMGEVKDALENKEEHIEMMMPEEISVSNLSDIKIPVPPKEVKVSNLKDIKLVVPDSVTVKNLGDIKFPEIVIPEAPTEISVSKPVWYTPTDLKPVVEAVEGLTNDLNKRVDDLEDLLKKPRKTQLLNKKGEVVDPNPIVSVSGGGSSGGGYTGIRDGLTFKPDSDYDLPIGGLYEAVPTTLSDGEQGVVGLTANREMKVSVTSGSLSLSETEDTDDNDIAKEQTLPLKIVENYIFSKTADNWVRQEGTDDGITFTRPVGIYTPDGDLAMDDTLNAVKCVIQDGGNTITVDATNLDIRDIVAATDSVSIHGDVGILDQLDLTNSNPAAVAIVDANGDQITSFGGGVEYTEGDTDATITGKAILMEGAANTLLPVQGTIADGLLVNLGTNNDVVVTATDLDIRNLDYAQDDVGVYGSQNVLLQQKVTTNDLIVTLDGESVAVTGTFWQATQPISAASLPLPTGASTLAEQQSQTAHLATIAGDTTNIETAIRVEDAAETAGTGLMMAGSVRRDTAASSAGTSGDNATINTDAVGRLWVTGTSNEDTAHASGDQGMVGLQVRKATPADLSDTDGDYEPAQMDNGRTWVAMHSGTPATAIKDLAATSTDYQITASATWCQWVIFQAKGTNVGGISYGGSSTPGLNYGELRPGQCSPVIFGTDLSAWHFNTSVAGNDVIAIYGT